MVARLVRDQEVVGSSPVTSTTKKDIAAMQCPFLFAGRTHDLFFDRTPENCASAEFLGRGETEANASIALSGNARKSRLFRRGFKSVTSTTKAGERKTFRPLLRSDGETSRPFLACKKFFGPIF